MKFITRETWQNYAENQISEPLRIYSPGNIDVSGLSPLDHGLPSAQSEWDV
ncbi:MAG: hypothetical protein OES12_12285 [Anaerolineae bacterium]|nr:hypothetical protein [Anaerolineae bacterium]